MLKCQWYISSHTGQLVDTLPCSKSHTTPTLLKTTTAGAGQDLVSRIRKHKRIQVSKNTLASDQWYNGTLWMGQENKIIRKIPLTFSLKHNGGDYSFVTTFFLKLLKKIYCVWYCHLEFVESIDEPIGLSKNNSLCGIYIKHMNFLTLSPNTEREGNSGMIPNTEFSTPCSE